MPMTFTKRSPLTGKNNTMTVNCTPMQYSNWQRGMLIQDAMPQATPDEREFLITGYTPEDWKQLFGATAD